MLEELEKGIDIYFDKCGNRLLIDYLNASRYQDSQTLEHIATNTDNEVNRRNINPLFTNIHCHKGHISSRKDDLISLIYLMLYFLEGDLPCSAFHNNKDN